MDYNPAVSFNTNTLIQYWIQTAWGPLVRLLKGTMCAYTQAPLPSLNESLSLCFAVGFTCTDIVWDLGLKAFLKVWSLTTSLPVALSPFVW